MTLLEDKQDEFSYKPTKSELFWEHSDPAGHLYLVPGQEVLTGYTAQ